MWDCHRFRVVALVGVILFLASILPGCESASLLAGGSANGLPQQVVAGVAAQSGTAPVMTDVVQAPASIPALADTPAGLPPDPVPRPSTAPYDPYMDGAPALEPVDPLFPDPAPVVEQWRSLDGVVRKIAAGYPGRISVVAVDLTTESRYEFRPNDWYYPASTFKLPVTICIVQAIQRGELTWETPVTFTKADDDTAGQGAFATATYGSQWPVRNLLDRSIIYSNNVAVKMLARKLTWDGLRDCTTKLGGMVTRTEDGSTPVRARDEAAWWLALWRMNQETPAVAADLLNPLRQVPYFGRIVAGTPRPDLVTHKFGTYPPYEHDGAIIWGERPYALVVLTYGGDHGTADEAIAEIAGAAWQAVYR